MCGKVHAANDRMHVRNEYFLISCGKTLDVADDEHGQNHLSKDPVLIQDKDANAFQARIPMHDDESDSSKRRIRRFDDELGKGRRL